ncbi:hypothetical protein HY086_04475 [Candidatus Gottesmanbacteria bacterium]|nr:hypothetical protein [Candidatus Gottesmanbacteria bacterium]
MHSFLLSGGTSQQRNEWIANTLKEWKVEKFDVTDLSPEETSIGIAHVREFQKRLLLAPTGSPFSVGVIRQADSLTTEAQNALLKTLEEPPPHARVILESPTADVFLPTVVSRCQLINLGNSQIYTKEEILRCIDTLKYLSDASIGKRLKKIDELVKNKEEAAAWLDLAIASAHDALLGSKLPSSQAAKLLRSLLKARQHLAANVNYKLVLDNIFLYN